MSNCNHCHSSCKFPSSFQYLYGWQNPHNYLQAYNILGMLRDLKEKGDAIYIFFFFEACYLHFRVIGFNQISNHCCKYSTIVFFTFFLKSIQVGGSMVCGICIGKIMNICNCVSSIKLLSKSSYQQSLVFVRVDEFFVA